MEKAKIRIISSVLVFLAAIAVVIIRTLFPVQDQADLEEINPGIMQEFPQYPPN